MERNHTYNIQLRWTGNTGTGTATYRGYKRDHEISAPEKPVIPGSSDPHFRGDSGRYNPEELLVAALSGCHMLWYLHLAADSGIVVLHYEDHAVGTMVETENGGGYFTKVALNPKVIVRAGADLPLCKELHEKAHRLCFIANSVRFPVPCFAETVIEHTEER